MDIYEKLIILEAHRKTKDEEDAIFDVLSEKFKQYNAAKQEYVYLYWLFTRMVVSAENIKAINYVGQELENRIAPTNMIKKSDTEKLNSILKCPYFCYMPQSSIDLMHQVISNLKFDKKTLLDIYYMVKRNKHLKESVDNILNGRENALKKFIPNMFDMLVMKFDIDEED